MRRFSFAIIILDTLLPYRRIGMIKAQNILNWDLADIVFQTVKYVAAC